MIQSRVRELQWARFTHDSPTSVLRHSGTRDEAGTVHVDGTAAPTLDEAVLEYGEHLVLAQMLSDDVHAVLCVGLDPGVAAVVMAFAEPG